MPHLTRQLMLQYISPRTTIFYIWDHITLQCVPWHHHFTPPHLKAEHVPHHTASVHILYHSTSTIPHHTHIQDHSIFHTTTLFHIALHHHIWQHIESFPCLTSHSKHTAHCIGLTFFITTSHRNFPHFAVKQHSTYQDTIFHTTPYSTSHTLHFSRTMSEIATFHIAPHFTSHHNLHQITPPHPGAPIHIKPTFHHTSPHSNINCTSQYRSTHSKPHHTSHCISTSIPHGTAMAV